MQLDAVLALDAHRAHREVRADDEREAARETCRLPVAQTPTPLANADAVHPVLVARHPDRTAPRARLLETLARRRHPGPGFRKADRRMARLEVQVDDEPLDAGAVPGLAVARLGRRRERVGRPVVQDMPAAQRLHDLETRVADLETLGVPRLGLDVARGDEAPVGNPEVQARVHHTLVGPHGDAQRAGERRRRVVEPERARLAPLQFGPGSMRRLVRGRDRGRRHFASGKTRAKGRTS